MSGLTPAALVRFREQIAARGLDLGAVAAQVGTSRAYLSRVLWQHLYSPETWARLRAVVTADEWATLLHVENCATWNRNAEAGEALGLESFMVRVVCAWCEEEQPMKACRRTEPGAVSHGICPRCFDGQMAVLQAMAPREAAHLVHTEAGLQVHRSTSGAPALCERELEQPDMAGVRMSCAAKFSQPQTATL